MTAKRIENYTHPTTLAGLKVRALVRLCLRHRIAYAMRPDGREWVVMCAEPDKELFVKLIEEAEHG